MDDIIRMRLGDDISNSIETNYVNLTVRLIPEKITTKIIGGVLVNIN